MLSPHQVQKFRVFAAPQDTEETELFAAMADSRLKAINSRIRFVMYGCVPSISPIVWNAPKSRLAWARMLSKFVCSSACGPEESFNHARIAAWRLPPRAVRLDRPLIRPCAANTRRSIRNREYSYPAARLVIASLC